MGGLPFCTSRKYSLRHLREADMLFIFPTATNILALYFKYVHNYLSPLHFHDYLASSMAMIVLHKRVFCNSNGIFINVLVAFLFEAYVSLLFPFQVSKILCTVLEKVSSIQNRLHLNSHPHCRH